MTTSSHRRPIVAIHGHLYQPPREDPWTGRVPSEPTAAPYHDWNERITAECYGANTAAAFGSDVRNNYELISHNVGPTLASWLDSHQPDVAHKVVSGDATARARTGWGTAIAHPYIHAILPLCNAADRATLIRWGIADFRHRYGRPPTGMWLPETALDTATLESLTDEGIDFTVVAPNQLLKLIGGNDSPSPVASEIAHAPVRVALPSGRHISIVVYDGSISSSIAFHGGLDDGRALAANMINRALEHGSSIATTDMESYGHHHRFGDLALAACLDVLQTDDRVELMGLEQFVCTVEPIAGIVVSPSAWSCAHGIGRWVHDCGCRFGESTTHNQTWRAPLRNALDSLRDAVLQLPELSRALSSPTSARDAYVEVIVEPSTWPEFARQHVSGDHELARTWLELQRHLLTMYSSCGWFFDDAAGHETLIVLRHARRAVELIKQLGGPDLDSTMSGLVAPMYSDATHLDGAHIWEQLAVSQQ